MGLHKEGAEGLGIQHIGHEAKPLRIRDAGIQTIPWGCSISQHFMPGIKASWCRALSFLMEFGSWVLPRLRLNARGFRDLHAQGSVGILIRVFLEP